MPTELACLNGRFSPIAEARVSIEDRGFQFADGVYEAIVFHGSAPLLLEEHLSRLANSCLEIDLDFDVERSRLRQLIQEGVELAGFDDTLVYLQVTRGAAPRNHLPPPDITPTVVLTFKAKPVIPPERRQCGIRVATCPDFRWSRCHIKSIALLPNIMAKRAAVERGFDDVIFIGEDDVVREASAANVFAIRSGALITPPQDHTILPGITRGWVERCAERVGLPTRREVLTISSCQSADELMLSSTTIDVLPVVAFDDHAIGDGMPGPWAGQLYDAMQADVAALRDSGTSLSR